MQQGKVVGLNDVLTAHDDSALHRVFKFANVSRPGIFRKYSKGVLGEARNLLVIAEGIPREKTRRQRRDIFQALAQGRKVDLDRVQPEKKAFTEISGDTGSLQIGIGG